MPTILVISPHPDDESIGCGGSLRKHVVAGDPVHVVFLTSGEAGGHGRSPNDTRRVREDEARKAAGVLGLTSVEFWQLPDGHVKAEPELIQRLRAAVDRLKPAVVYVPHDAEMHPDHRAAVELVAGAIEAMGTARPAVFMYEVWTPIQVIDHVEDISDVMSHKLTALREYRTQCEVMRLDDAVQGLNRYRGVMHTWPGCGPYAEIFKRLVR